MLVVAILIALASATAVFGVTFWSYGSLLAFVLALFCATALVFSLAVTIEPRHRSSKEGART